MDVSLVIVSYNTRELLAECLDSLPAAAGDLALQVLVVDNASSDGTPAMVRERHPEVELIENRDNLGFSRAVNRGLAAARGRILVWLNPDCTVGPGVLAGLASHLDRHPEVGAVGPRLVYPDGRVQPSAQAFPGVARIVYHFLGLRRLAGWRPLRRVWSLLGRHAGPMTRAYLESLEPGGEPRSADWVSGACLATPAAVARRVGPLDEGYFMYCEDTDWCHRVHDLGLEVRIVPSLVVTHHVGASGPTNPESVFHYYRSLLRYFLRRQPSRFPLARVLMGIGFGMRGLAREAGRLVGRRGPHAWWRLARLCWDPSGLRGSLA